MLMTFLEEIKTIRNELCNELIDNASNPVMLMRRFRMLSQLSFYESTIITKIQNLKTDEVLDFLNYDFVSEAKMVASRDG